ncbi:hypothetical protein EJ06DRAFT_234508 [Trichodelitschia bisporula]|uniref:Uncharacterized protein n=1 Tax=Trichodelitschia bisporula TaxID=703511 RepID=A0A6G1HK89_9PEZI|nr:hypothetical protein EJ06DRAFT_234508 [Trichodelitschia bisporula]
MHHIRNEAQRQAQLALGILSTTHTTRLQSRHPVTPLIMCTEPSARSVRFPPARRWQTRDVRRGLLSGCRTENASKVAGAGGGVAAGGEPRWKSLGAGLLSELASDRRRSELWGAQQHDTQELGMSRGGNNTTGLTLLAPGAERSLRRSWNSYDASARVADLPDWDGPSVVSG